MWLALALASAVIGAEVLAWSAPAHRWLLRRAALALPPGLRERYYEEWLCEMEEVPSGPLTRGLWVLSIYRRRRFMAEAVGLKRPPGLRTKRAIDICVAGTSLLVLGPLLLLIATLIRLTTGLSPTVRTLRKGPDGRVFRLLRFRTVNGLGQPTRLGRLVARYDGDSLPMITNVLRGDLSLVGPSPALAEQLQESDPEADVHLKAGLVGPSLMVTSGSERLEAERHYIESWSTGLDLKILRRAFFMAFAPLWVACRRVSTRWRK